MPAAFTSSMGRSSRHIPFLFRPRLPLPALVFSSPSGLERFSCWDMPLILSAQVEAKSRKSRYSFEELPCLTLLTQLFTRQLFLRSVPIYSRVVDPAVSL